MIKAVAPPSGGATYSLYNALAIEPGSIFTKPALGLATFPTPLNMATTACGG